MVCLLVCPLDLHRRICIATTHSVRKFTDKPIPAAVLSKAYFCGRSTAGITGSNPAEGTYVRLWCLFCAVSVVASATNSSHVQISHTVCMCMCVCAKVCDLETSKEAAQGRYGLYSYRKKKFTDLTADIVPYKIL
jgi:hypothetical protein